jgi:hypothetical protein
MPWEHRNYGLQWVKRVPRIPAIITNSIVYLYQDKLSAQDGVEFGASGFMLAMPPDPLLIPPSIAHVYVITNKHVIEQGFPVVRANLREPRSAFERTEVIEFTTADWVTDLGHDLAVCALPPDYNLNMIVFSPFIPRQMVMTHEEFKTKDIGPGDNVFYVGRFAKHAGKYENMPSVRFGNISMNPNEREPITWETTTRHYEQVGFLVEARSRSGYSGSPVFFLHQHVVNNPRAVIPMFDVRLLGVDWGHLPEKISLTTRGNPTVWEAEVHAGMMGVVPSWNLLDFLDTCPELIEQRRRDEEYYKAHFKAFATGVPEVKTRESGESNPASPDSAS